MTTLLVKVREPEAEVHRSMSMLVVYDVRASSQPAATSNVPTTARLSVVENFGVGHIRAMGAAPVFDGVIKEGRLSVMSVTTDNHVRYKRSIINVQSVEKAVVDIAKPVDENQIEVEAGQTVPLTSIDLDMAVSFDTYFDFNMRSVEGIRTVIDENNNVVESAYDSYRLSDLVPGQPLRRTILTSNDFRIALNIRPTIVKSSQG